MSAISCFVRNALKKQDFHKYVMSIHYNYEKKHSLYNSETICGGILTLTPNQTIAIFAQF